MNRKRTLILTLLCLNSLPLLLLFSSEGSASWLGEGEQLNFTGTFVNYDPSVDFDANGILHYTFTQYLPENGQNEIGYFNNSDGEFFVPDFIELSEARGINAPNTTENGNSDIAVDNETVHVVWQGKEPSGTDFEIFYTNNSLGGIADNILNLTDDSNDDITPAVAAVDGNVFIVYYSVASGDLVLRTNLGSNTLLDTEDPTSVAVNNDAKPKLSVWKDDDETNWRIDLVYIDSNDDIRRTYIVNEESAGTFSSRAELIGATTATELKVDSSETVVAVAYEDSNDIYVWDNVSGSSTEISGASNVGNPDVIINENNIIQVFFSYNQSADESYIITTNNFEGSYSNFDYIIGQDQIPRSGVTGLHISSFDVEQCAGDGVFILYDGEIKTDASYERKVLFLNSYVNIYSDGTSEYNYLTWEDDLTGKVAFEGWLIESMGISFNTSTGTDISLKVRITDNVTGATWENTSIFSGSGGNKELQAFFQPDEYYIARNPMIVELLNGSTDQELVKIEIDPLLLAEGRYNYTSNYQENSSLFPYSFVYGDIGSGFEDTIFRFDISNELQYRDTVGAESENTFDTSNHVDMYKFNMEAGEQYNMSITTDGGGSEQWKLKIYNSSVQITNESNALMIIDSTTYNDNYFQFYAQESDDYCFVIENHAFGEEYNYTWEHHVCPILPKITGPSGTFLTDDNSNFIKDINGNLFQIETNFTWDDNEDETLPIDHYLFNIYDSGNQKAIPERVLTGKELELTIYGGDGLFPNYDLEDGIYYLNITSVSSNGQLSRPIIKQFNLDTTPPEKPVLYQPPSYFLIGSYIVNWTVPSDGLFSVHHYELYRGTTEDFIPSESNKISIGDTLRGTTQTQTGLLTGAYYYKLIAVDNVGNPSQASDPARYVVSIGGVVDPKGQKFQVLEGDFLEYQVVDVYEEGNKDPSDLYMTFNGKDFQINTLIRFYLTIVTADQVLPVRANWYSKSMNITATQSDVEFELLGEDLDIFPLVTTADEDYQTDVFELFMTREFNNVSKFTHEKKNSWYFDTFTAIDVVIHSFFTEIDYNADKFSDINFEYDAATFIVDAHTGVVIEMTLYNTRTKEGYSLKLVNTNVGLSRFQWWLIPLITIAVLGAIAAVINQIIKKLERRV